MSSHRVLSSALLAVVLLHAAVVCLTMPQKEDNEDVFIGSDYYLESCKKECTPGGRNCSSDCSCVIFERGTTGICYKVTEKDITDWSKFPDNPIIDPAALAKKAENKVCYFP
uniref:Putative secreted protein n=1 Tax=Amblyomma cajennense TaxID=34607 RepID=A0A023FCG7_AMBCJ